jgi:hypothetical protein
MYIHIHIWYIYTHIYTHTYIYIHTHVVRDNKIVLVSLSEGTFGGGRSKEHVREWKYWNHPCIYEYNTMHCTVGYWILGEHGDREWVSDGGEEINLINAWYIQTWSTKSKPPWTVNIHLKKKNPWRAGRKIGLFGAGTSGRGWAQGKGGRRVNMVDVFCIYIWK